MNKLVKYSLIIVAVAAIAYAAYTLWQKKQKNTPVALRSTPSESPSNAMAGGYDNGIGVMNNVA